MPSTPARTPDKPATPRPTDRPTALLSAGALAAFVAVSVVWPDRSAAAISTGFSWSARWFGAGWQLLLLATWVVAVLLALTPWASARLGTLTPQFPRFHWVAMIMCTLLAGGGVFWAAAEPMYHYTSTPPLFAGSGLDAAHVALAQSFTDWGFLAWAVLGSLGAIVLLYAHERGMPLGLGRCSSRCSDIGRTAASSAPPWTWSASWRWSPGRSGRSASSGCGAVG